MKTDIYTKVVLTIIAAVLTINLLKGFITPAQADTRHFVAVPVKADGTIDVNIQSINSSYDDPFKFSHPIPVVIKGK